MKKIKKLNVMFYRVMWHANEFEVRHKWAEYLYIYIYMYRVLIYVCTYSKDWISTFHPEHLNYPRIFYLFIYLNFIFYFSYFKTYFIFHKCMYRLIVRFDWTPDTRNCPSVEISTFVYTHTHYTYLCVHVCSL